MDCARCPRTEFARARTGACPCVCNASCNARALPSRQFLIFGDAIRNVRASLGHYFFTLPNVIDLQRSGGAPRRFPIPADAIRNVQAPLAQEFSVLTCAIRNVRASFRRTFPPRADCTSAASTGVQRKSQRIEQGSIAQARAQQARERGEDASAASTGA